MQAAGHAAIWPGFYIAGCAGAAMLLTIGEIDWSAVAFAFVLAVAVYLFDRVKLQHRRCDPADAEAHPARAAFIGRHQRVLRPTVVVLAVIAVVLGWFVHPMTVLFVPAALAGVYVYGSTRRRPRIKDRLVIKNLAVGLAIGGLAVTLSIMVGDPQRSELPVALCSAVAIFLVLHVMSDAMLCDIDDMDADAAHGTRTLPNVYGVRATWQVALLLQVVAGGVLVTGLQVDSAADQAQWGLMLSLSLLAATGLLQLLHRRIPLALRDLVDLKLPLIVAILSLLKNVL